MAAWWRRFILIAAGLGVVGDMAYAMEAATSSSEEDEEASAVDVLAVFRRGDFDALSRIGFKRWIGSPLCDKTFIDELIRELRNSPRLSRMQQSFLSILMSENAALCGQLVTFALSVLEECIIRNEDVLTAGAVLDILVVYCDISVRLPAQIAILSAPGLVQQSERINEYADGRITSIASLLRRWHATCEKPVGAASGSTAPDSPLVTSRSCLSSLRMRSDQRQRARQRRKQRYRCYQEEDNSAYQVVGARASSPPSVGGAGAALPCPLGLMRNALCGDTGAQNDFKARLSFKSNNELVIRAVVENMTELLHQVQGYDGKECWARELLQLLVEDKVPAVVATLQSDEYRLMWSSLFPRQPLMLLACEGELRGGASVKWSPESKKGDEG